MNQLSVWVSIAGAVLAVSCGEPVPTPDAGGMTPDAAVSPLADGAACAGAAQCGSGFCVSGVCCASACTGSCEACSAALTGTANGTCAPARDGAVCRASTGTCDVAETCTQGVCPADSFAAASTSCRAAAGACDLEERCTGTTAACPADVKRSANTVCRPSAGSCDVEDVCDGTAVDCPETFAPSTTECRPASGVCDQAEQCPGSSATCPTDALRAAGASCRAAAGACDAEEVCTGSSVDCPTDVRRASGDVCRPAAGSCDAPEVCDGTALTCPTDAFLGSTVTCRASAGACDAPEVCSGASPDCSTDVKRGNDTTCRPPAAACDRKEDCDGVNNDCPPDTVASAGTVCRAATGPCDVAEACDGVATACGADALLPATTVGPCGAYRCTGTSALCTTSCAQTLDCSPEAHAYCQTQTGQCRMGRLVFASSARVTSDFGGVAVAQSICNSLAQDAGLSGRFDAWLSAVDGGVPATRFNRDGGAWLRRDKLVLATDFTDLTTGPTYPNAAVGYDERGVVLPAGTREVWTGTDPAGYGQGTTSASFCNDWTLSATSSPVIYVGLADSNTITWTQTGAICNLTRRLYCFEQ